MLDAFPGRTLEELDGMDWGRYKRARQVAEIRRLESLRIQQAQGLIKGHQIGPDDWAAIGRHEELIERYVQLYNQPDRLPTSRA